jgi:hypothetical protein
MAVQDATAYGGSIDRPMAGCLVIKGDVDALDEARDIPLSRSMQYQQNLQNYHSRRVRPRSFEVGDLVLRLKQDGHGKLESP